MSKHGIDFADAMRIFDGFRTTKPDTRFDYRERRWISVGVAGDVVLLAVVLTDRAGVTRLIPARRASRKERMEHETALRTRPDA